MKSKLLIASILLSPFILLGQANFQAKYGFGFNEYGVIITVTQDGYLIEVPTFCTDSNNVVSGCYLLMKTDWSGETQWTRSYFDAQNILSINKLLQRPNGFMGAGTYVGTNGFEPFIARFDEVGDSLWMRTYKSPDRNNVTDLVSLPDGGHMLYGQGKSSDSTTHMYMMKVDSSGNELWTKILETGYPQNHSGNLHALPDGGFLVGLEGSYINNQDDEALIVRTDSMGNALWVKSYHTEPWDNCDALAHPLPNGGYVLQYCKDTSNFVFNRPAKFYGTDAEGNKVWEYIFQITFHELVTTIVASNGDIIGCGRKRITDTASPYHNRNCGWLFRMSQDGELLWNRYYVSEFGDDGSGSYLFDLKETPDGGIAAVGITPDTIGQGSNDVWLVKVGPDGCFEPGCTEEIVLSPVSSVGGVLVSEEKLKVWPNPASKELYLEFNARAGKPVRFRLFDSTGRLAREWALEGSGQVQHLNISGLASGLYFWQLNTVEGLPLDRGKLVIVK